MAFEAAYVAPHAARIKARVSKPVMIAGRFNQPQLAEQTLAAGDADMCAMTRVLICDPELPDKTNAGRVEDVRACIACNQACIGRLHMGFSVSCIQHPETGRELIYGDLSKAVQEDFYDIVLRERTEVPRAGCRLGVWCLSDITAVLRRERLPS
jgi:hypothetical protein